MSSTPREVSLRQKVLQRQILKKSENSQEFKKYVDEYQNERRAQQARFAQENEKKYLDNGKFKRFKSI